MKKCNNFRIIIQSFIFYFPFLAVPKSFMYWDHNDVQSNVMVNGETPNDPENTNCTLLVYALDFSDKVVKLVSDPILRQELPAYQAPLECILLPIAEKNKTSTRNTFSDTSDNIGIQEPRGQVTLVCKDGVLRLIDLSSLKIIREAKLEGQKFISAAYCSSK